MSMSIAVGNCTILVESDKSLWDEPAETRLATLRDVAEALGLLSYVYGCEPEVFESSTSCHCAECADVEE